MVWRSLLIINLLLAPVWTFAQTNADDYFHKGAQYYIFGEKTNAVRAIVNGLRVYPQDTKLNAVAQLLKRKDPEDKNQQKKNQQGQKQDQDQKQQDQGQNSDQKKKDEEQAKKEQEKKEKDKEKEQQQAKANSSDQRDKKPEDAEQAAMAEAKMSPEEARQLLESQQDNEKILIFAPENKPVNNPAVKIKDW
jgi:Ca-activated chloride channel homolog